jgi:hypothetical protein
LKRTWNQKRVDETLVKVDKRIEANLRECEDIDNKENVRDSLVKLSIAGGLNILMIIAMMLVIIIGVSKADDGLP